jgi:hypothetical protein
VSAQVKASTVFGAIYGLETLSQLIQWDADVLVPPPPLFSMPWWGILFEVMANNGVRCTRRRTSWRVCLL